MSKSIPELLLKRLFDSIFDANLIGKIGERMTENELNLVKILGRDGMTLHNVYIPKENGETSEIDVLFICSKGIVVFESKNYSGWIFGNEKDFYWTVSLASGTKNKFYNPISQNRSHLKWLGKCIGADVPLFSMIVFSDRCELKNITITSPDVYVIKRNQIYASVRKIWNNSPDILDEKHIHYLYESLHTFTNVNRTAKQVHIENINQNYKSATYTIRNNSMQTAESNNTFCPWCGGQLVLRTAKKGYYAGKQFWGCSNYPECKFLQNI